MSIIESPTVLIPLVERGIAEGFRIIASIEFPMAPGCDQSGICAFDRGRSPFGEDRRFGHIRWSREPNNGVRFYWGHYDLTREEAIAEMVDRAGVELRILPGAAA